MAFILDGELPPMCVCVDKVFTQLSHSADSLYVTALRLGSLPTSLLLFLNFRFSVRTRLCCSRAAHPPTYRSQRCHASGGSRSKRSSFHLSSKARLPTGQGPTPIPDRASLSPSTAPPLQPPPQPPSLNLKPNLKTRPSWIHSLKPSIPSPLPTM